MRVHTILRLFFSFISLIHNLFNHTLAALTVKGVSFSQRVTASVLLLAMLLPVVFFGQVKTVSANTFPVNPLVEMPSVLLAPPQPFSVGNKTSIRNFSPFLAVSILDYFTSWFDSTPENTEPTPIPTPPTGSDLSRARLSPKNQTGGTSLYSRNFSWGTGLAGLSGRGLDAGFGISYNSLIWTRVGNEMIFNPNNDNITPGFRFGFPVIEPQYSDSFTGKNTFLMVTPSGGRVEFRQLDGSSDTFETVDSSYIQLKVVDSNNLTITGTDGTNAFYQLKNGAFRCSQIKDANGNFITVDHDTNGLLQKVIDTLGREINVNYDAQGSPISITQQRSTGTFTFATFTYSNWLINPNFPGLNLVGINAGTNIKVLQRITYADNSSTYFNYNAYGMVWKVTNYAADSPNHVLSYVWHNAGNDSNPQMDVPRFSEIRNWTENFNLDSGGEARELSVPFTIQENVSFVIPGGAQVTGTLIQVTAPDTTITKTYVGNSGWMEGLPILTEDWANDGGTLVRKRWNNTTYTQDGTNPNILLNPRVIEARVGDTANNRRTTMEYWTNPNNPNASVFGLVKEVKVYDANQTTVLKRTTTDYNLDPNYLNRRIIGLPQKTELFDQANALMAKVTYAYDEGDFSSAGQNISPINHDSANYGANFIVGRGNATSSTRWDVTDPNNGAKAITARVKYNTAGNPVSSFDPLNREIKTSYNDNFEDGLNNRNTFAYPTAITDPAGLTSTVKYRFDIGANVFAQSPAPAGQAEGKKTSRIYDNLGRLQRETVVNTGAYTRYEYPENGIQSRVFSTVSDVNNNGPDAADEVLSETFTDGAGRVLRSRTEHPGSVGGFSGTLTEYDNMGRVRRSSVPTEINGSWTPSGDDASRGWLWSAQEYDWKGRTIRQINTDGTDKLISYDGCGCAGGQVTTVSSEQLAEGRRRQKVYEDILGRTYKSETLNWDGSIYSTSKTTFNGRDQAVLIRNYSGAETSTTFQDTAVSYDGHGRVKTQHLPQQDANKATIFDYNPDDSLAVKTDARGATSTYTYDNRKLVTRIDYVMPTPPPPPVPPNNYSPLGTFEGVDSNNGNAWGWSFDPDNPPASNTIHFYLDGPAGSGTYLGSVPANQTRADVNQANNITGDHGFVFSIPQAYWDDTQHALYAYGIDTGTNSPTLLGGSPKYFTIADPNPPSCNPLQFELNQCQWSGGNWNYDTCSCDFGGYYYSRMINPTNRKKYKADRIKKLKKVKEKKEKKTKKKDTTPITAMRCFEDNWNCQPDPDPDPTPNPNPTPTPPPPTPSPYGVFETVDTTNRRLKGWALDPNNPNTPVRVVFSIGGNEIGSTYANQARPDVNQATGVAGNHGFVFDIPRQYLNGQSQTVSAYLVVAAPPPTYLTTIQLSGSPKTFGLTYQAPTVLTNTSVIFTYDNLGNRTSMTDSVGNTTYEYNQLSQLTAETRQFNDDLPNAPLSNNRYKLNYAYSYSGQLKSMTDPFGEQINYGHDRAGRLNSVTGSPYGNVTNYATNPGYRAWGGLNGLTYGNGFQMSMNYNNRLQASNYQVAGAGAMAGNNVMQKNYQYYNDGSLKYTQDALDPKFDRLNKYDQIGRISEGKSGAEARGETVAAANMSTQLPYRQSYQYDAFNNMTQRNNLHWGIESWYGQSNNLSYNYNPANNRITGQYAYQTWTYDADGRVLATAYPEDYNVSQYDAAGMLVRLDAHPNETYRYYDGNGRESKRRKLFFNDQSTQQNPTYAWWEDAGSTYYIRSSILGNEVLSEVSRYGDKIKTNVMAAGNTIAVQENHITYQQVTFNHWDASGSSFKNSDRLGYSYSAEGADSSPGELDPMGGNVGTTTPYVEELIEPPPPNEGFNEPFLLDQNDTMYVNGRKVTCTLDGMSIGCGSISRESAVQCPNNDCGPIRVRHNGQNVFAFFTAYGDGYSGYVPSNARYGGNGMLARDNSRPPSLRSPSRDTDISGLNGASGERDLRYSDSWGIGGQTGQSQIGQQQNTEPCIHNINIINQAGISKRAIKKTQEVMSSIFSEADVTLTFNKDNPPSSKSTNYFIVESYPDHIVQEMIDLGYVKDASQANKSIGGFQSGRYFGNVYVMAQQKDKALKNNPWFLGRKGTHEVGHKLLRDWETSNNSNGSQPSGGIDFHPSTGIMSYAGFFYWGTPPTDSDNAIIEKNRFFHFRPEEIERLKRCNFINPNRR